MFFQATFKIYNLQHNRIRHSFRKTNRGTRKTITSDYIVRQATRFDMMLLFLLCFALVTQSTTLTLAITALLVN